MTGWFSGWLSRWFGARGGTATPPIERSTGSAPADQPAGSGAAPMLDCEAVMRQLWDYLDGELTPERMAAVRAHLDLCKRCFPQLEFERSFLDAVARTAPQHSDPDRLRERIVDRLRASGMTEP